MKQYDLSGLSQQIRDECLNDAVKLYLKNKKEKNLALIDDVIKALFPSKRAKETKLLNAISEGSIDLVSVILENGVDPNFSDGRAFKLAVLKGQDEIVRLLLEKGADINKCDRDLIDHNIVKGRTKVIDVLKEYGAKI